MTWSQCLFINYNVICGEDWRNILRPLHGTEETQILKQFYSRLFGAVVALWFSVPVNNTSVMSRTCLPICRTFTWHDKNGTYVQLQLLTALPHRHKIAPLFRIFWWVGPHSWHVRCANIKDTVNNHIPGKSAIPFPPGK